MSKVGIVFGSNAGDAKAVAEYIAKSFDSEIIDAKELEAIFLESHDKLIFVASTHKVGELQNDFKAKLDVVKSVNFSGKTLALVGVGGQVKHPTTFVDGLVEFLPVVSGAKLVGESEVGEYKFTSSKALKDGKFIGLVVDVKADANWQNRADAWIKSVKGEF